MRAFWRSAAAATAALLLSGCMEGGHEAPISSYTVVSFTDGSLDRDFVSAVMIVRVDTAKLVDLAAPLLREDPVLGSAAALAVVERDAPQLARDIAAGLTVRPLVCSDLFSAQLRHSEPGGGAGAAEGGGSGWVGLGDLAQSSSGTARVSVGEDLTTVEILCSFDVPLDAAESVGFARVDGGWRISVRVRPEVDGELLSGLQVAQLLRLPDPPPAKSSGTAVGGSLDALLASCEDDGVFASCLALLESGPAGPYADRATAAVERLAVAEYDLFVTDLSEVLLSGPTETQLYMAWPGRLVQLGDAEGADAAVPLPGPGPDGVTRLAWGRVGPEGASLVALFEDAPEAPEGAPGVDPGRDAASGAGDDSTDPEAVPLPWVQTPAELVVALALAGVFVAAQEGLRALWSRRGMLRLSPTERARERRRLRTRAQRSQADARRRRAERLRKVRAGRRARQP